MFRAFKFKVDHVMHRVHLWLDGKCIVDFLLVIIEHFSLAFTVEALWADIGWNRCVRKGGGAVTWHKFQGEWGIVHQRQLALEN